MDTMNRKQKLQVAALLLGLFMILLGLVYSSCNGPVYAQDNVSVQDSTVKDSTTVINIPETRRNLIKQLQQMEEDKMKIIGILEYLDYLEKKNK